LAFFRGAGTSATASSAPTTKLMCLVQSSMTTQPHKM
jgi:hypothetical protein